MVPVNEAKSTGRSIRTGYRKIYPKGCFGQIGFRCNNCWLYISGGCSTFQEKSEMKLLLLIIIQMGKTGCLHVRWVRSFNWIGGCCGRRRMGLTLACIFKTTYFSSVTCVLDITLNFKGDNNPVENVTWFDTVIYANKLSEKEGLPPLL